ncbi:MAG TPA: hypothetical protein VFC69_00975 [Dysgonamonadaceae bacterium]|nr:hypothetical protein [Dysgonamonadaceae bacterium]
MKKFILFAAVLFSAVSLVKADEPATNIGGNEGRTELTVTLNPIQIITVNQSGVNLIYNDRKDYNDGVKSNEENHLIVYSTGGFTVTVKSLKDELLGVGDESKTIPSNTISVKASPAAGGFSLSPQSVALSMAGKTLFSSVTGGADLKYNVEYAGANLDQYFDKLFNAGEPSVFKTDVIYTITPL